MHILMLRCDISVYVHLILVGVHEECNHSRHAADSTTWDLNTEKANLALGGNAAPLTWLIEPIYQSHT